MLMNVSGVVSNALSDEILAEWVRQEMYEIFIIFIFLNFGAKSCKDDSVRREHWEIRALLLNKRC